MPAEIVHYQTENNCMRVFINGEVRDIPDAARMDQLIELLELGGQRIAVEVNLELVPRSRFTQHRLHPDDKIEIIHAVGGG